MSADMRTFSLTKNRTNDSMINGKRKRTQRIVIKHNDKRGYEKGVGKEKSDTASVAVSNK